MSKLIVRVNLDGHDELYQDLIDMHQGLTAEAQDKATAKLILLLANHIGDAAVVREAIDIATSCLTDEGGMDDEKRSADYV